MIFSTNSAKTISVMENELHMFWRLSRETSALCKTAGGLDTATVLADLHDELEVLSEMTDWNSLRCCVLRTLARLDNGLVEAVA